MSKKFLQMIILMFFFYLQEEKQKAYRRERKKAGKRKADEDYDDVDPDMAAVMGFSGFGSASAKK